MKRIWIWSLVVSSIIILDQLTKGVVQSKFSVGESLVVIENFFSFTYVRNPGAAFGFLAGASTDIRFPLFKILPVLACFWLVYLIWTSRNTQIFLGTAYSLIFAGAVGNLIDRFSLDYVVDFLDFYYVDSQNVAHHFPAFNVADSAITIAGFMLFIDLIMQFKKGKKNLDGDNVEDTLS